MTRLFLSKPIDETDHRIVSLWFTNQQRLHEISQEQTLVFYQEQELGHPTFPLGGFMTPNYRIADLPYDADVQEGSVPHQQSGMTMDTAVWLLFAGIVFTVLSLAFWPVVSGWVGGLTLGIFLGIALTLGGIALGMMLRGVSGEDKL